MITLIKRENFRQKRLQSKEIITNKEGHSRVSWKSYVMYIIPAIWDSGKDKTMTAAETSVIARNWREGKPNRQSKEDFQGRENTLDDTTALSIEHYTFVQTREIYTPGEPSCKLWTLGEAVSVSVHHHNKCIIWWESW